MVQIDVSHVSGSDRDLLLTVARDAMVEQELLPDFSSAVNAELDTIAKREPNEPESRHNVRDLLWCSIDNDDSEDLDQLTSARSLENGSFKIYVAIANLIAFVAKGGAIDHHARQNTTSVYTAAEVFPMLPDALSHDLTSLVFSKPRKVFVVEISIDREGSVLNAEFFPSMVTNQAKLTYKRVGAWLEGQAAVPEEVERVPGLSENLLLQNRCAQLLREQRYKHGALDLETIESRPVFQEGRMQALTTERTNKAKQLIEDFMIAANVATSRFLKQRGFAAFRRVVRVPKNWTRIVEVASEHGTVLPEEPDSIALAKFVAGEKRKNQVGFPDFSLTIIKLLGKGEYVVDLPGSESIGHFGLAVQDYTHSTAPNRRYPDLVTQRILKAALQGEPSPYRLHELVELAQHCTQQEDSANKVERRVHKSAAALLLSRRIGEEFEGICTGASEKGTWVRIFNPPVEGKLLHDSHGAAVGQRLKVKLVNTGVDKGFIDFAAV